ncbi:MAG: type II restriction endonuclease [Pyrinomonadaceae bacterium]
MNRFRGAPAKLLVLLAFILSVAVLGIAQRQATPAELGSETAKNGFRNEDEICDKFNAWKTDEDAIGWLAAMNYKLAQIESVTATKPHGEKADVEVRIKTRKGESTEGISIKLVSSPNGFNQIDKRWLSHYVKMWGIPSDVESSLKLFLGETPPDRPSRDAKRMYLNELDPARRNAVVEFFSNNRPKIAHDLFAGDGSHAAGWIMVALKSADKPRWVLRTADETIKFFSEGKVEITSHGNLKMGRITMQRKGGDGGRETAKMLQFKINPVELFNAK